jgi:hypothetical protein
VIVDADEQTGRAVDIERVSCSADEIAELARSVSDAAGVGQRDR